MAGCAAIHSSARAISSAGASAPGSIASLISQLRWQYTQICGQVLNGLKMHTKHLAIRSIYSVLFAHIALELLFKLFFS